ncbi:MAG: hypothetical protein NTV06_00015, partial [candidate division Zixibacteria bacterium]|nr:hypothetical protein [candidate division Zixibacteria bacterium]
MSFKILSSDELPGEEWSLLTGDSFLSSPAFASLWEIFDGRAVFLVEEENGALKAGMAGVVFGRKYIRRFKSMPDGLYGGIFWAGGISDED